MVLKMAFHTPEGPRTPCAAKESPYGHCGPVLNDQQPLQPAAAGAPSHFLQSSKKLRPSDNELLGVVEALAKCSASSPMAANILVFSGFVQPLVNVLTAGAAEPVMLLSLRTLAHLAGHREQHGAIRQAGVLELLMSLLNGPSLSMHLGVLEVMHPLARDSEMKGLLREAGALKVLTKHIQAGARLEAQPIELVVAEAALGVIKNLAANAGNQDALRSCGAIKALVTTLTVVPATSAAAVRAASALSNLAVSNEANKNAIREAGGIPRLVSMLHVRGESAAAATEALGNLAAKNTANKDATREAGGVAALAAQFLMLTNGSVPDKLSRLHRVSAVSTSSAGPDSFSRSPLSSRGSSPTRGTPRSSHGSVSSSPVTSSACSPACSQPNSRPCSPRAVRPSSPPPDIATLAYDVRSRRPMSPFGGRPSSPVLMQPLPTFSVHVAPPACAMYLQGSSPPVPGAPSTDAAAALASGVVPSPPGTARVHAGSSGSRQSQPHPGHAFPEMAVERTAWALRNLTASSGLNTAIIAAHGITSKALEGSKGEHLLKPHGDKQAAPPLLAPQPKPPAPKPPPLLPLLTTNDDDDDDDDEPSRPCTIGIAMTQFSKTGRGY